MKIVHKNQAKEIKIDTCTAIEYPTADKDINCAIIEVNGRYPVKNRVFNQFKELVYITKGSGKLYIEDKEFDFNVGDEILIEPNEKYYWDGDFTMLAACTPAFDPKLHKEVR